MASAARLCSNPAVDPELSSHAVWALVEDSSRSSARACPHAGEDGRGAQRRKGWVRRSQWGPTVSSCPGCGARHVPATVGCVQSRCDALGSWGRVRRLQPHAPIPDWFGPQTVVICTPATARRIRSHARGFDPRRILEGFDTTGHSAMAKLLRRVNDALPEGSRLRLGRVSDHLRTTVLDPEVYTLGVYRQREASYLTSASVRILTRLADKGLLEPQKPRHSTSKRFTRYWRFSDLVAVRTWQFLKRTLREAHPAHHSPQARRIRRRRERCRDRRHLRRPCAGQPPRGVV